MKNVCIFLLLILPLTGVANPYEDISSLKTGDWIRFEIVGYYPEKCFDIQENVPWRTENIRKMVIKATVLEKTGSELTLGYQLEYLTDCRNDSVKPGFYYYDSRYRKDFPLNNGGSKTNFQESEIFFINNPDKDFTRVTYDMQTGDILSSEAQFKDMHYNYSLRHISRGIEVEGDPRSIYFRMDYWNLDALPQVIARTFIAEWASGKKKYSAMPLTIKKDISPNYTDETHVIDASFALPPNVRLTYIYPDRETKKQKTESCAFFSTGPQRYEFAGKQWLIIPGDSITLTENKDGETFYSGKGISANNFIKAKNEEGSELQPYNFANSSVQSIESHLKSWNSTYDKLYTRYAPELDPYWKMSFKQTQSYYTNYVLLMNYLLHSGKTSTNLSIDWHSESFSTISPFTDYMLIPEFYEEFLTSFVQYKVSQLTNDNLTAIKTFRGNSIELFHLQRQILAGYPRYKANAVVLNRMMQEYMLQEIEREYNEYIADCPDRTLLEQVKQEHQRYMKIEPGKYIQHSGLDLTKEISLNKGKKKSYTLLNLSLLPLTQDMLGTTIKHSLVSFDNKKSFQFAGDILETDNLSEALVFRFYRSEPEHDTQVSEEKKAFFSFLPEKQLKEYINQATGEQTTSITLVIRDDGKILFRSLNPFFIPFEQILNLIKEDLNKQEPATAGSSFWLRVLISFCIGGITVFIWGRIRQRKEKSKRLLAQLEMKALRSQMNPHFIFNALNSIQNLITRPDVEQANRYLLNFAKLLRLVLSTSEKKLVPLSEEIEQLRLYVDLEQLRLPFEAEIQISDTVNQEMTEIPGMLIQPLVENAIKHGIVPQGGGKIEIRFEQTDTFLKITVEDNGPGIPEGNPDEGSGFGLKAVRERLKLLQSEYHAVISMRTENRKNRSGCRITLSIPLE